jgi:hypothetical protein
MCCFKSSIIAFSQAYFDGILANSYHIFCLLLLLLDRLHMPRNEIPRENAHRHAFIPIGERHQDLPQPVLSAAKATGTSLLSLEQQH